MSGRVGEGVCGLAPSYGALMLRDKNQRIFQLSSARATKLEGCIIEQGTAVSQKHAHLDFQQPHTLSVPEQTGRHIDAQESHKLIVKQKHPQIKINHWKLLADLKHDETLSSLQAV